MANKLCAIVVTLLLMTSSVCFSGEQGEGREGDPALDIEKQKDAGAQIMHANRMMFDKKEPEKVVQAFEAVSRYFPTAEKEIAIAQGNMAMVMYNRLDEKAKAAEILRKLIENAKLPIYLKQGTWAPNYVRYMQLKWGSKESISELNRIGTLVEDHSGSLEVYYAVEGVHRVLRHDAERTEAETLARIDKIRNVLKGELILRKGITMENAMLLMSMLEELTWVEMQTRVKMQPGDASDAMKELVAGSHGSFRSRFPPPDDMGKLAQLAGKYPRLVMPIMQARHGMAADIMFGIVEYQAVKNGTFDDVAKTFLASVGRNYDDDRKKYVRLLKVITRFSKILGEDREAVEDAIRELQKGR